VGGIAVQLAHAAGAYVVATASKNNLEYVRNLGADEVLDYRTNFENETSNIDLVLDLVGGEALHRLWHTLSDTGHVVTTAVPEIGSLTPSGRRGQWVRFYPDAELLADIGRRVARKEILVEVGRIFSLPETSAAIEQNKTGHTRGKIVIHI
jgi:NADPH:quinone reductase-like Zn-dependent oxidoreductase